MNPVFYLQMGIMTVAVVFCGMCVWYCARQVNKVAAEISWLRKHQ